jgi:hypothetical protein
MSTLLFIPQPVEMTEGEGQFTIKRDLAIVLPAAADDADLFAAYSLQDFFDSYTGLCSAVEKRYANDHPGQTFILARADRDQAWLRRALPALKPEGYLLEITPEGVLLLGADAPGLFYAVQTMGQLLDQAGRQLPALSITDFPALPNRGVMLDISRGKVPSVASLLELIDLLASWKVNEFQLYLEHTFHWPSHPKIGQGYDPLSAEDMLLLDSTCAMRHIDFVPNLQSFGHQGHLLRLKQYAHLAETKKQWTLSPAEPGVYTLLDELYQEFLPNFRSPRFNVDSDETWDLGQGKSAPLVAQIGMGRVYLNHVLRLRELAQKYGRRIMFWGDIILHSPELIQDIPDDVTVLQWEYGENPNEADVRKFADAGKKFYVCPGTNSWSAFFPRQREARRNISKLATYGVQYGALGLLNTDWGDGGHYNLQGLSFYGYAFGAAESWNPGASGAFDAAFGRLYFGPGSENVMEAMRDLEYVWEPAPEVHVSDSPWFHMKFLTGSPFRRAWSPAVLATLREHVQRAEGLLKRERGRTRAPLTIDEIYMAAYQDLLFVEKLELAVDCYQRYTALQACNDIEGLEAFAKEIRPKLRALARKAEKVPEMFATLWLANAHEAGLSDVLEFQLEVPQDLLASAEWINQSVKTARKTGAIRALPEVNDDWVIKSWAMQMG